MIDSSPPDDPNLFLLPPTFTPGASPHPSSPGSSAASPTHSVISHLALPQPILPSHPSLIRPRNIPSTSARLTITPIPPSPKIESSNIADSLPRSLRDLQSFGSSTVTARPPLLPLTDARTVRQGSFTRQMREFEQVLRALPPSEGSTTVTPGHRITYDPIALITGSRTLEVEVVASPGHVPVELTGEIERAVQSDGVDEIPVEWCWYCHEEGLRSGMELHDLGEDGKQWICGVCAQQQPVEG